jgi:hypothetical protein
MVVIDERGMKSYMEAGYALFSELKEIAWNFVMCSMGIWMPVGRV